VAHTYTHTHNQDKQRNMLYLSVVVGLVHILTAINESTAPKTRQVILVYKYQNFREYEYEI